MRAEEIQLSFFTAKVKILPIFVLKLKYYVLRITKR